MGKRFCLVLVGITLCSGSTRAAPEKTVLPAPIRLAPAMDADDQLLAEAEAAAKKDQDVSELYCDQGATACREWAREFDEKRVRPPRSPNLYRSACSQGDDYSCVSLAMELRNETWAFTKLKRENFVNKKQVDRLDADCLKNDKYACYAAALAHRYALGAEANPEKGVVAEMKACLLHHSPACLLLGDDLGRGNGTEKSVERATQIFLEQCKQGDSEGCFFVGFAKLGAFGDIPSDAQKKEALDFFRKSCRSGNPHGCASVGWSYLNGSGVQESTESAIRFYELACRGGHHDGCRNLGLIWYKKYEEDPAQLANREKAWEYYWKACDMGDGSSCDRLAYFYVTVKDGKQMPQPEAQWLWEKACRRDVTEACDILLRFPMKAESRQQVERKIAEAGARPPAAIVHGGHCTGDAQALPEQQEGANQQENAIP